MDDSPSDLSDCLLCAADVGETIEALLQGARAPLHPRGLGDGLEPFILLLDLDCVIGENGGLAFDLSDERIEVVASMAHEAWILCRVIIIIIAFHGRWLGERNPRRGRRNIEA